MNMKELGMQIAREQSALALCDATTDQEVLNPVLAEAFAKVLYTWICKAKAAELSLEYYKGLLGQIEASLGSFQEASYANLPGEVAALVTALAQANLADRLKNLAKDSKELAYRSIAP